MKLFRDLTRGKRFTVVGGQTVYMRIDSIFAKVSKEAVVKNKLNAVCLSGEGAGALTWFGNWDEVQDLI